MNKVVKSGGVLYILVEFTISGNIFQTRSRTGFLKPHTWVGVPQFYFGSKNRYRKLLVFAYILFRWEIDNCRKRGTLHWVKCGSEISVESSGLPLPVHPILIYVQTSLSYRVTCLHFNYILFWVLRIVFPASVTMQRSRLVGLEIF